MKPIDVAVGIILDPSKSKVLLAQRNTNDEYYGLWEFPGGKIDSGESAENALIRELKEELNIDVSTSEPYENFTYEYVHQKVNLKFFLVTQFSGEPEGREGQKIQWKPINDLGEFNMLEANKDIIDRLQLTFV